MAAQNNAPLPDGLEIAGYRIVKKIASGGFSIVYLASDEDGNAVAIKEYLPSSLALRQQGELVPSISNDNLPIYRIGLKCFFEEGRALARISHPNVVSVLNFFRANETVYMVMAYESGRSLQEHILRRRDKGEKPLVSERFIRRMFNQVMNGLREVHTNKLLHLDLKPANIYLRLDGTPILLDFGAARQTLKTDIPKLYPMYTPGFAAPELYQKNGNLGPWTDIYSIGASIFACMIGAPPQPSDQRKTNDKMDSHYRKLEAMYSLELIEVVRWCLKLDPLERPQSVFALQKALATKAQVPPEQSLGEKLKQKISGLFSRGNRKTRDSDHTTIQESTLN
ncbi:MULTISPECIES: serine/threonine-protein kinase [unclassified Undibacterium]|uniref:serine/threonine protein kinase n=1 Tax=unclassified Undibacterium TaxID=2630295 RepID=UPI002AC993CB|nr:MULTISPECIES: serine/threonine-protein kinase [unclassified Undibacterium]MEB0139828.1 serine/threonine-protein kinase [Undibacterium sp. CCC2.1]MEB0172758.1 serine/threonine-protein kinase [Undibacterium sp. CCC1.1]MEB0176550.1 serine/threonine-protein kinase [Undibacterium sp. CCC3.4]MEB0215860.1 serine/threonine-protein kinase [Undibacterium sp. 5I2]WPX42710.1 serine/threonine-protein kinase [Undibacterium sp. CCC3.4]